MSQSTLKSLVDWLLAKVAEGPRNIAGDTCTSDHHSQWRCMMVLWCVLLAEVTDVSHDELKPYFMRNICASRLDLVSWCDTMSSICQWVTTGCATPPDRGVRRYVPVQYLYRAHDGDIAAMKGCYNLGAFCQKAEFDRPSLRAETLEKYLDSEQKAATPVRADIQFLLADLNKIIRRWFGNFHITDFRPGHGPGITAERAKTRVEKWRNIHYAPDLDFTLCELGLGSMGSYCPPTVASKLWWDGETSYTARYTDVPKSLTKRRSVRPEPATLQWAQHGVQRALYDYIESSAIGKHIPIRNQGQNQIMAQVGSITGDLSTIDLSAASDSVTEELVLALFAGTELGTWLERTRSTHVQLPDKSVIPTAIFAGMGSALCFPVESIVFASVCEYVSERAYWYEDPSEFTYSVYGDDIIVPTDIVKPLCVCLRGLGFVVNDEKSFTSGHFRESCGMFAYKGVDITPLRYPFDRVPRVKPVWRPQSRKEKSSRHPNPVFAAQLVSCANRAVLEYGYGALRSALLYLGELMGYSSFVFTNQPLQDAYGRMVVNKTLQPYSPDATNGHLLHRWSKDLQRDEWKGVRIVSQRDVPNHWHATRDTELHPFWLEFDHDYDFLVEINYHERLEFGGHEYCDMYDAIRAQTVHLRRRWTSLW